MLKPLQRFNTVIGDFQSCQVAQRAHDLFVELLKAVEAEVQDFESLWQLPHLVYLVAR